MEISPDGKLLLASGMNAVLRLWDLESVELRCRLICEERERLNTHVSLSSLRRLQAFVKGLSDPHHRSRLTQAVFYDQLTQVFCQLAQRHLLIVVLDDLQWIDPGSVNLLFHLARQIAGSKILILGAYRPEEGMVKRSPAAHPLQGVVQELGALYGDIQIDLMQSESAQFVKGANPMRA